MEMALLSKNKLGFVDGTIAVPNVGEVKYPYWKQCNNMVSTWIMRFSEANIFRISYLHAEIHQIRQGDLTVSAYFSKLKSLWDELQVIRPLPTCKCERVCNCGLLDTLQQHLESDNLLVFLRGLNETYASVQSQIMMTKPLPNIDEAFMMVQQQERRFNSGTTELLIQEAGIILLTQGNGSRSKKFYPNGNKKPICSYCGFTGHTTEKCYKKHGYPPGWKPRNRGVSYANQVQFASDEHPPGENGSLTLSQDEYRMLRQLSVDLKE
ncbi:PREDICTED: uncharacterized protein LOC109169140 [Ipomoea nil]|uniref:uncharacterized protein LOC109169140 n=1 Tax=Ipomoea nil TaxID=35883 RepID=UPI0009019224|nr:PREDICTED: uncharacterized protein LOC109169140 [Ipomoea nil]